MLSIYNGGCIRPLFNGSAVSLKPNTLTPFSTMLRANVKPSKKFVNFMVQKWEGERVIKPHQSARNSEQVDIEAVDDEEFEGDSEVDGPWKRFREKGGDEPDYDKDPEIAEILGSCLDDPDTARSKVEERLRKKRNRIVQTKTGSARPMKVTFNNFDYSNSYIWFEFDHPPQQKDVSLICDMIRSWHIIGRLGGCNSLNMQLSQSPSEKRPSYDAIQGANVDPATFYNIGDLEIQDNLARIWVDIGTSEPLLLDVLLNGLTQISSDFVGIKQVVLGGSEFENWNNNVTTEDGTLSVHKI